MWVKFETSDGEKIAAEYPGGPYVDLFFDDHPFSSDVINVWDYEKGAPAEVIEAPFDLARVVAEWVNETALEDPRWYDNYLANLP